MHSKEIQELTGYIEHLKQELQSALHRASPESMVIQEKITALQCDLIKKDNEISFLKETVRIECEERMGLVALLAQPRSQSAAPAERVIPNNTSLTDKNALEKALAQVNSSKSPAPELLDTLSTKDAEFLRLFKNANAKNLKRLAKQSKR